MNRVLVISGSGTEMNYIERLAQMADMSIVYERLVYQPPKAHFDEAVFVNSNPLKSIRIPNSTVIHISSRHDPLSASMVFRFISWMAKQDIYGYDVYDDCVDRPGLLEWDNDRWLIHTPSGRRKIPKKLVYLAAAMMPDRYVPGVEREKLPNFVERCLYLYGSL